MPTEHEQKHDDDASAEMPLVTRSAFAHPPWMTGVVLVFGVIALVAGVADPIWWVIGFPAILVLVVDLVVRVVRLVRRS